MAIYVQTNITRVEKKANTNDVDFYNGFVKEMRLTESIKKKKDTEKQITQFSLLLCFFPKLQASKEGHCHWKPKVAPQDENDGCL